MNVEVAVPADIPAIMAIERGPGFETLVGRWTHEQHAAEMAKASVRYLVLRNGAEIEGFTLLQRVGEPDARVHLKRIAVGEPGVGTGSRLLAAAVDWLFSNTSTNRLDLDVYVDNALAEPMKKRVFRSRGACASFISAPTENATTCGS